MFLRASTEGYEKPGAPGYDDNTTPAYPENPDQTGENSNLWKFL